jgi:undecaprenyl phosphate-alpha-L-ara4N flippase subunit ArnE
MQTTSYILILGAVVFEVIGQICFKRGTATEASASDDRVRDFWIGIARSRWTYAGVCAYAAELFLWVAALHFQPLSRAFPLLSLTYCGVAIAGRWFLKERISAQNATGIVLITLGAACIVSGS